ncbi:MAG: hypothetical protein IPP14_03620 [Planctomycetes bacterium]|nr:hypothetical protein [Planctomycetota bacterium]
MSLILVAGLALTPAPLARGQEKADATLGAAAICDRLLSSDVSQRERGALELNLITAKRAEELGREILRREPLEAREILEAIGEATGNFALVGAIVALESEHAEVRNVAFEALLAAPLDSLRKSGDDYLKNKRRTNLKEMLSSPATLKVLCEGIPEPKDVPKAPIEPSLHLAILADRYFGSEGFVLLMRTLGKMMAGDDSDNEKEEAGDSRDEKEARNRRADRERLRRQAAALFEAIWISPPGAQFNYVANAPIEERRKSIGRMEARLEEIAAREIEVKGKKVRGGRLGDYLIGLFSSDVSETVAAAYLRMQWWKGDSLALEGEGYSEAVEHFNTLGRRERMALRNEIKTWWESFRAETDPR